MSLACLDAHQADILGGTDGENYAYIPFNARHLHNDIFAFFFFKDQFSDTGKLSMTRLALGYTIHQGATAQCLENTAALCGLC